MSQDSQCPHARGCELYSKFSLKGSLKIWQFRYCNHTDRHKTCRRFVLSAQGEPVPSTLLPNGDELITE